jgi:hypothetical protein
VNQVTKRLVVTMSLDRGLEADFNRWYNLEHVPSRLGMPVGRGFSACSRYVVTNGSAKYLNIYDADDGVFESDEYKAFYETEADQADVKVFGPHFTQQHKDTFRRLIVLHRESLAEPAADAAPADGAIVDVVRGTAYADLPIWTRSTLTARLALSPTVVASSVWDLADELGFAIITDVRVGQHLDWRHLFKGALGSLPEHALAGLDREVVFGHTIGRYER